ncbi:hypothetical protein TWF694_007437 [Orbilia ellipsospora]|uniref:BTB domain-containing protein n=1 Tax=Orbilia ellipsospora TaxID=2528407 RepID=A0AAV9XPF0_9PEZI
MQMTKPTSSIDDDSLTMILTPTSQSLLALAACKPNFKEGIAKEIELPEIKESPFKSCVRWIYGEEYAAKFWDTITSEQIQKIINEIETAGFLGINGFKRALLASIGKDMDYWMSVEVRPSVVGLWEVFVKLAKEIKFNNAEDKERVSSEGTEIALAVIADIHAKSLMMSKCKFCMISANEKVSKRRCSRCANPVDPDDGDSSPTDGGGWAQVIWLLIANTRNTECFVLL